MCVRLVEFVGSSHRACTAARWLSVTSMPSHACCHASSDCAASTALTMKHMRHRTMHSKAWSVSALCHSQCYCSYWLETSNQHLASLMLLELCYWCNSRDADRGQAKRLPHHASRAVNAAHMMSMLSNAVSAPCATHAAYICAATALAMPSNARQSAESTACCKTPCKQPSDAERYPCRAPITLHRCQGIS